MSDTTQNGQNDRSGTEQLKTATVQGFTVFNRAKFTFSRSLNVFVGENSTGKTHVLKLLYSILAVSAEGSSKTASAPTKTQFQSRIADKLINVFRVERVGRLAARRQGPARSDIALSFYNSELDLACSFSTHSKSEIIMRRLPSVRIRSTPVYIPTKELLTLVPEFVPIYDRLFLQVDETWRDTCVLLTAPMQRGPRDRRIRQLLDPLEEVMEGKLETDKTGRFFLRTSSGLMEIPLVAEGLRKLGMIARLIATGQLVDRGYLFWDEPESNLNPTLIRGIARTIVELSKGGVQVFIATHSLFLLRELEILLSSAEYRQVKTRFFGLNKEPDGVIVEQGPTLDAIGSIASLDEDLQQSDRFLEASNLQ